MTSDKYSSPGAGGVVAVLLLALAAIACCAAPALLAAGALGVLGALPLSGWLIGAGALGLLAALGYALRRVSRVGERADPPCCLRVAPQRPARPADEDRGLRAGAGTDRTDRPPIQGDSQ